MFRLAFLGLLRQKTRVTLVALAVVLGVTFASATLVLSNSIQAGLQRFNQITEQDVDLFIQGQSNQTLSADLPDLIEEKFAQEIKAIAGLVETPTTLFMQKATGEEIESSSFFKLASSWINQETLNPYIILEGSFPLRNQEVVLDIKTAQENHLKIGDLIEIASINQSEARSFEIVGIADLKAAVSGQLSSGFARFSLFNLREAQQLLLDTSQPKQLTHIKVDLVDSTNVALLSQRLYAFLPAGVQVVEANQVTEARLNDQPINQSLIKAASYFLLTFITLAMLVGLSVIVNTFNVLLTQRSKELALLRALAFSKKQIRRLVITEALMIGCLATIVGITLGIILSALVLRLIPVAGLALPITQPILSFGVFIYPAILGISVTILAAWLPARRASRLSPIAVLTETEVFKKDSLKKRLIAGLIVIFLGLLILTIIFLTALSRSQALSNLVLTSTLITLLVSCLMIFIGLIILSPFLIRLLSRQLARLYKKAGVGLFLATGNIWRQARRSGAASNALIIGLTLVVLITALISSFQATIHHLVNQFQPADWSITIDYENLNRRDRERAGDLHLIPTKLWQTIKNKESVINLNAVRYYTQTQLVTKTDQSSDNYLDTSIEENKGSSFSQAQGLAVLNAQTLEQTLNLGIDESALQNLKAGQILLHKDYESVLKIGEEVTLEKEAEEIASYRVGGFFDVYLDGMNLLLDSQVAPSQLVEENFTYLLFDSKDGYADQALEESLRETLKEYPGLTVYGKKDIAQFIDQVFGTILNIFRGALSLSLVIAFMGIFNILSLSIIERRREMGILRALGMTRWQLQTMVAWEAVIMVIYGTISAFILGLFFAFIAFKVLISSQVLGGDNAEIEFIFNIPYGDLLFYSLIALTVALTAALLPALRAARLNIVKALSGR